MTAKKMPNSVNSPATGQTTSKPNQSGQKTLSGQKTEPGNGTAYQTGDGTGNETGNHGYPGPGPTGIA